MDITSRFSVATLQYTLLCFVILLSDAIAQNTAILAKRTRRKYLDPIKANAESFRDLIFNSNLLVDRSLLIKSLLDHPQKTILITSPPRWSKTTNLQMLQTFLQIETDPEGNRISPKETTFAYKLFNLGEAFNGSVNNCFRKPFLISQHQDVIDEYLGEWPVVHIPFKLVAGLNDLEAINSVNQLLKRVYAPHNFLIKILLDTYKSINQTDTVKKEKAYKYFRHFKDIWEGKEMDEYAVANSLHFLCKFLYRHHRKRVVVLVDDYDAPFYKLLHEKHFLETDLKYVLKHIDKIIHPILNDTNKYVERVVITASHCFTDLLPPGVFNYTLASNPWSEYFTFSRHELAELCQETNKMKQQRLDAIAWYAGYKAGRDRDLNLAHSHSVVDFLASDSIKVYFTRALGFDYVYRLVNIPLVRETLELLAHKQTVTVDFNDLRFNKTAMHRLKQLSTDGSREIVDKATLDLALTFLCASGYLTFEKIRLTRQARIWAPNKETLGAIFKKLDSFYTRNYGIPRFLLDKVINSLRDYITADNDKSLSGVFNALFAGIATLNATLTSNQNPQFYEDIIHTVVGFISIKWRTVTKCYTLSWKEGCPPVSYMLSGRNYSDAFIIAAQYNQTTQRLLDLAKSQKIKFGTYNNIVRFKYVAISFQNNKTIAVSTDREVISEPPNKRIKVR